MNEVRKRKYRFYKNNWCVEDYLGNMLVEQCFDELKHFIYLEHHPLHSQVPQK